ncbi:hypothetical protein [Streptosporangium sandarakinum]
MAARLPGYLTERLRSDTRSRWEVIDQADMFRVVGAACLPGAAQVAAWLNRREFRTVPFPRADAERISWLLRDRKQEWRRDLAHRLVDGLRPGGRGAESRSEGEPGWELAATLVIETGIQPPENDAFVAGWVWDLHHRLCLGAEIRVVRDHPLLDIMVPRLFHAVGVAHALAHDWVWNTGNRLPSIIGALTGLAAEGRVDRQVLLNGCVSRFLNGGEAGDAGGFVTLWRELQPTLAELPVVDLVRVLPIAASPLAQLATDELRRADEAVGLDDDLFAEAVYALAFRPEKKHVTAALRWIAQAAPERADGSLAALAQIFGQDAPALRDRAVRLALKLAPHASRTARDAVREAAAFLPPEPLGRIADAFGAVEPMPPHAPVAGTLPLVAPLPDLPAPIASATELAGELLSLSWPHRPMRLERVLSALVELTHRDHAATVEALQPWWKERWGNSGPPYVFGVDHGTCHNPYSLLSICAIAVVSPSDGARISHQIDEYLAKNPPYETVLDRFVRDRFREVIALLAARRTIPVLLATPTAPTGHLDAGTLVDRLERLGDDDPLPLDFCQALLRLPRAVDPAALARAERLTSAAGRRLTAWLRGGGLADPAMAYGTASVMRNLGGYQNYARVTELHARMTPPQDLPEPIRDLCTLEPKEWFAGHSDQMAWWPTIMPSHREVLGAHVLECFAVDIRYSRAQVDVLPVLVRGEGPVGAATASAIVMGMGHKLPGIRGWATDAAKILTARGELPTDDLGWALGQLFRLDAVTLNRVAPALEELALSGAHTETWAILACALPALLPSAGDRPATGLADLLAVAVKAAALAGARADVPGLAELAARKGRSRPVEEARSLLRAISPA